MFCSECGAKAAGKFCSSCGSPLTAAGAQAPPPPTNWSDLTDYAVLLSVPEVRDRIARAAALCKKKLTGEDYLDMYGKALGKLTGVPLPMTPLAHFAQSAAARLGLRTGKSRSLVVSSPPGAVLVALLCSLAREGRKLRNVHQNSDGCLLTAELPSDLFALEGELHVGVTRAVGGTRIDAHTEIPGQYFDWGKSNRCLDGLLAELTTAAAA